MFKRILDPLTTGSFFIFGARGTGKSTFVKEHFVGDHSLYIDLLNPELESRYSLASQTLTRELDAFKKKPRWVIIDEIQKVPKLLDLVHSLIEDRKIKFILTGSSARKLRGGAANLLAGRAYVYYLYPLTVAEIGEAETIENILRWGSLPRIFSLKTEREKKSYLEAYIRTYFAEEIRAEQILRKLDPFRAFLPILGQVSGKIINHKKIADEIGVSTLTVQSYFQIVEDTLLGFYLPAFHESLRKSQRLSPKFYLFDTGIKKALEESLEQQVTPRTSVYGELFESFLINEIYRLNAYYEKGFRFSYYSTKNNVRN
jgi:predicted AAA+ superfamily ATPase